MIEGGSILYFLIPDPAAFQSGGNLYNLQLINALKGKGVDVKCIEKSDLRRISNAKERAFLFVDTLYLDEIKDLTIGDHLIKILIVHHLESLYPPSGWTAENYFTHFEKSKLEIFDAFLCSSSYTKEYLILRKLGAKHIIVIPPAIGFEAAPVCQSEEKVRAILVANLVERKGIFPFLEALLERKQEKWLAQLKVTLIGGFNLEPEYARACLELLKAHAELASVVDVKGALSHSATLAAYPEANLFISTSFMETFGMAMQEAIAFGLPVLALKGGNISNHIISEKQGLLFGDMPTLVEQLGLFCQSPQEFRVWTKGIKTVQTGEVRNWSIAAKALIKALEI